jgi:hypothetical protein
MGDLEDLARGKHTPKRPVSLDELAGSAAPYKTNPKVFPKSSLTPLDKILVGVYLVGGSVLVIRAAIFDVDTSSDDKAYVFPFFVIAFMMFAIAVLIQINAHVRRIASKS